MVPTVSRLVRIQQTVGEKVISKSRFYNTFDYFGNKRKVRAWTVIRKLLTVYGGFFKRRRNNRLFEKWVEMTRAQDRLTIFVTVVIMTEAHSFRSQVWIGSASDCLLGLSNKIIATSYSEVGLKTEKSGGATGGEGECGEVEEELLASERRSLDILKW